MVSLTDILSAIQNGVSAANTLNGIITGATQNSSSLRVTLSSTIINNPPTNTVYTTGSGTYTTPANTLWLEVEMVGGGGGGAGSGTAPGAVGTAGNTTFGTLTANAGGAASAFSGGSGGTATGGYLNITGVVGGNGSGAASPSRGGSGGNSYFGGAGAG